jgi:Uncharacterized Fe-S protein PflX, homolog of pyruvate formate lyase activating proteins
LGRCLVDDKIYIARHALHFWEEPIISGTKGSGAVFFGGCTMRCVFCQNQKISRKPLGETVSVHRLAEIFEELDLCAENVNLVSPTPYVESIIKALEIYRPRTVVYNTGGYETIDTIRKLNGYVDIYLPDLKYVDNDVSNILSKRKDYFRYAFSAIDEMCRQIGKPQFDENGMLKSGVIIRHLVLPSYVENSIQVLKVFAENFKGRALLSLMSQYTPVGVESIPKLNRTLTPIEYKRVLLELDRLGITDGFLQELDSATSDYIPDFRTE